MLQKIFLLMWTVSLNLPAHPDGTSKVFIQVYPGRPYLDVTADINSSDILNLVIEPDEWESMYQYPDVIGGRMAHYLQSYLILNADSEQLTKMKVIKWHQNAASPAELLDSALLAASTHVITMRYEIPENSTFLEFSSQMFAQYKLLALCQSWLVWKSDTVLHKILPLGEPLTVPLQSTALAELLIKNKLKPTKPLKSQKIDAKRMDNYKVFLWVIFGAITLTILTSLYFLVKKNK